VDYFTKYVEIFPLRKATSENVVELLWKTCCRWGVPKTIISDNGSQFSSKLYFTWCKMLGISPFNISPYHAQANPTERYNQTIKNMIISTITRTKDWDCHIDELSFALRTSINDSTGFTPAYANCGREFRTPFDNLMQIDLSEHESCTSMAKKLNLVNNTIKDEFEQSQETYMKYYNRGKKVHDYTTGDKVWLKTHFLSNASLGFSSKLAKKNEGPYTITSIVARNVYDLISDHDKSAVYKVHANELSPFYPRDDESVPKILERSGLPPSGSTEILSTTTHEHSG